MPLWAGEPAKSYEDRSAEHDRQVLVIQRRLEALGFIVTLVGVERLGRSVHRLLMECGPDPTAQLVRHQGDLLVVAPWTRRSYLCEVKTTLPDRRSGRFSFELASYHACMSFVHAGGQLLVVFGDGQTAWIQDIQLLDVPQFRDPAYLATLRRGSKTPFDVTPSDAPYLRPLEQFAREELGCPQ